MPSLMARPEELEDKNLRLKMYPEARQKPLLRKEAFGAGVRALDEIIEWGLLSDGFGLKRTNGQIWSWAALSPNRSWPWWPDFTSGRR